ncbi:Putative translation initiation inhibitor, yjgF family (modular protein) [Vibrio nigripulchritudo MADA3029]|nr:Putative translation initiation inhibitor, yjgF family (modular protein) [Vibrio nigripulchritudo MADA3020]CCN54534.1 Putative translation initiation inhibitor, yjgF family (modular protein) [Vibrio nigripulchritudo MADA3021]CCN59548.1 Putative translation initiation inhibitor, yjgF family (modular protein) [Vibrio nigripulchritudo MADA3029]
MPIESIDGHFYKMILLGIIPTFSESKVRREHKVIERKRGIYQGRNKSSAYKDLVWTVATSSDTSLDIVGQTQLTLDTIQNNLNELGSDKTQIVSAQVYIANMADKPLMDKVWCDWMGENPDHWPQRACLGVDLEGDVLIEVTVTAVR